jgi:hypothetical protein
VRLLAEPGDGVMSLAGITFELLLTRAGDHYDDAVAELPPGQRALLVLIWCQGQIDNGGMWQLLGNNTGRYYDEYVPLAEHVGAAPLAELFRDLHRRLGVDQLPRDSDERNAILDGLAGGDEPPELDDLDERFYALDADARTSLDTRLWEYVRAHPGEFLLSPDEAAADEELLIAALRESAATARSVRGVATEADVAAAEERVGAAFPPLLRRLYLEVANGGWGPHEGLMPLDRMTERCQQGDLPAGWLPLFAQPDGVLRVANLREPAVPVGRFDSARARAPVEAEYGPAIMSESLRTMLQMWLAGRKLS